VVPFSRSRTAWELSAAFHLILLPPSNAWLFRRRRMLRSCRGDSNQWRLAPRRPGRPRRRQGHRLSTVCASRHTHCCRHA